MNDVNQVSSFITSVGFPIFMTCVLLYGIYKISRPLVERLICAFDKAVQSFDVITKTNEELVRTNSILASRIENKMDIVIKKLDDREVI